MVYPWATNGLTAGDPWATHWRPMGYSWETHGLLMGDPWATHEGSRGYPRETHGLPVASSYYPPATREISMVASWTDHRRPIASP